MVKRIKPVLSKPAEPVELRPAGLPVMLGELSPAPAQELEALQRRVAELETALRQTQAHLAAALRLADHDVLVPLLNRRAFAREVERAQAQLVRHGRPSALLFIDVDGFKAINDRFGHAVGDRVLMALAGILRRQIRASDVAARLGGDEFAVLLLETGVDAAKERAAQLAERIAAVRLLPDVPELAALTVSVGVAAVEPHGDAVAAIAAADRAMYGARATARRQIDRENA